MPGNNSGLSQRAIESRYGPPGQRWILDEGIRGGVPARPGNLPFWRTPETGQTAVMLHPLVNNHQGRSKPENRIEHLADWPSAVFQ